MGATLGIDPKLLGTNGHLSGAIYSRMSEIIDALLYRLEEGDEFRSVATFTVGDNVIHNGQILTFDRLDNVDILQAIAPPLLVVLTDEDGDEISVSSTEFIQKFRFVPEQ